jgi:DUF1365 family protein
MNAMASALYAGTVVHRRIKPRRHGLRYRVFSLLLDLDELPDLDRRLRWFGYNRFGIYSFSDRDHGPADGTPLRPWVEAALARAGIDLDGGAIRLLCYPRVLGYVFNPLSVFFCHHRDGRLRALLYEVRNTFGEKHGYLIPVTGDGPIVRQRCDKALFVSPFIDMQQTYHFRIRPPDDRIAVAIRQDDRQGALLYASFTGTRQPMTDRTLAVAFLRYPLLTFKVIGGIHWEALKLWLKGVPLSTPRPSPPATAVSIIDIHDATARSTPHA